MEEEEEDGTPRLRLAQPIRVYEVIELPIGKERREFYLFIYLICVRQRLYPLDHRLLQFLSCNIAREYGRECQKVVDGVRLIVGRK